MSAAPEKLPEVPDVKDLARQLAEHLRVCRTDTPWWASGFIGAVGQLGPIVVISFVLLGMLSGVIPSSLSKVDGMDATVKALITNTKELTRINRIICRNTAKSDTVREMCDER